MRKRREIFIYAWQHGKPDNQLFIYLAFSLTKQKEMETCCWLFIGKLFATKATEVCLFFTVKFSVIIFSERKSKDFWILS